MLDFNKLSQEPIVAISEIFSEIHSYRQKYISNGRLKDEKISDLMISVSAMEDFALLRDYENLASACNNMYSTLNDKAGNYTNSEFELQLANIGAKVQKLMIAQRSMLSAQDLIFEINESEKNKILKLSAEIRAIITLSQELDDNHKNRLLDRISAVEKEVHRPKGKFDVILGGVVDFGDALGRFGDKVKPLVDRYNEIRGITQSGSKEYEKLPPPEEVKRLPAPEK